jgi:hypothetical protein
VIPHRLENCEDVPIRAMRQPRNNMFGNIISEHLPRVIEPRHGLCRITALDYRRPIEIETGNALAIDPSTFRDEPPANEHWLARAPRHLFDCGIGIEPCTGGDFLSLAGDRWNSRIYASRRPHLPSGREHVVVLRHVGDEIIDLDVDIAMKFFRSIASRTRGVLTFGAERVVDVDFGRGVTHARDLPDKRAARRRCGRQS